MAGRQQRPGNHFFFFFFFFCRCGRRGGGGGGGGECSGMHDYQHSLSGINGHLTLITMVVVYLEVFCSHKNH